MVLPGDGGGADQDEKWAFAQGDGGEIHSSHRPHEATGEETETNHQQVQVRALICSFGTLNQINHNAVAATFNKIWASSFLDLKGAQMFFFFYIFLFWKSRRIKSLNY